MNRQANFTLAPSSLTDALYQSLRRRIVNGDIAAGEKLTEHRIATEYDVARPTAKACLERLTVLGLLRRSAHKTAVVPDFHAEEIRDLFFSRGTVESAAVTVLAGAGRVPAEAAEAQLLIEAAARDGNFEKQVDADIAFHTALVSGAGSDRLSRMHELIMGEVHLTMGRFQAHRSAQGSTVAHEHATILAGIQAGDPEAARLSLAIHLDHARDRLLAQLEPAAQEAAEAE
ncbi:GntR family transcriptional regulator [Allonocardiopsis opalescens]|uniref:GntR family transcriptional regulator n=1 Tax=Allonocardiopsis opalescens TaxID=1144618 RepID=A0A2T0PYJ5_9ACTN|nr:GntR family transcriptional regulator [Allonocardiopsis opalescens]PRX96616.1 GntR family transcriptional regulator [Allonocardiopsis opalescens]